MVTEGKIYEKWLKQKRGFLNDNISEFFKVKKKLC